MADIDRLSRRVPCLSKVAPAVADIHMEDVHRAGGIFGLLGELDRAGLLNTNVPTVHTSTLKAAIGEWDIMQSNSIAVRTFYAAAPGGVPSLEAFSQDRRWDDLDVDRKKGVIRSLDNAYSNDGGLAVLFGNIALEGCIVKTAGVDESILVFEAK
jgi:dihydroxyacid dehydratase (EC 4.2.1.9)